MDTVSKRKLAQGETILLGISLLAVIGLGLSGQKQRASSTESATATDAVALEAVFKSLIVAVRENNGGQQQSLTTSRGLKSIENAVKDKRFGSYQKLSERMAQEWGDDPDWGSCLGPDQQGWGIHHNRFGKADGGITFQRTPTGWKMDEYLPSSEKTFRQYRRARDMSSGNNGVRTKQPTD